MTRQEHTGKALSVKKESEKKWEKSLNDWDNKKDILLEQSREMINEGQIDRLIEHCRIKDKNGWTILHCLALYPPSLTNFLQMIPDSKVSSIVVLFWSKSTRDAKRFKAGVTAADIFVDYHPKTLKELDDFAWGTVKYPSIEVTKKIFGRKMANIIIESWKDTSKLKEESKLDCHLAWQLQILYRLNNKETFRTHELLEICKTFLAIFSGDPRITKGGLVWQYLMSCVKIVVEQSMKSDNYNPESPKALELICDIAKDEKKLLDMKDVDGRIPNVVRNIIWALAFDDKVKIISKPHNYAALTKLVSNPRLIAEPLSRDGADKVVKKCMSVIKAPISKDQLKALLSYLDTVVARLPQFPQPLVRELFIWIMNIDCSHHLNSDDKSVSNLLASTLSKLELTQAIAIIHDERLRVEINKRLPSNSKLEDLLFTSICPDISEETINTLFEEFSYLVKMDHLCAPIKRSKNTSNTLLEHVSERNKSSNEELQRPKETNKEKPSITIFQSFFGSDFQLRKKGMRLEKKISKGKTFEKEKLRPLGYHPTLSFLYKALEKQLSANNKARQSISNSKEIEETKASSERIKPVHGHVRKISML